MVSHGHIPSSPDSFQTTPSLGGSKRHAELTSLVHWKHPTAMPLEEGVYPSASGWVEVLQCFSALATCGVKTGPACHWKDLFLDAVEALAVLTSWLARIPPFARRIDSLVTRLGQPRAPGVPSPRIRRVKVMIFWIKLCVDTREKNASLKSLLPSALLLTQRTLVNMT